MYYPAWLLPAAWICAALTVLCGVARFPGRAFRQRDRELACFALLAAALTLGGAAGLLFNRRAPHLTAEGLIYDVRTVGEGTSVRREFKIFTRPDPAEPFEVNGDNPHLRDGQLARVTWQAGSHRLLGVEILTGIEGGYSLRQPDGTAGAIDCLAGSVLLLLLGVARFVLSTSIAYPVTSHHVSPGHGEAGSSAGCVEEASALDLG